MVEEQERRRTAKMKGATPRRARQGPTAARGRGAVRGATEHPAIPAAAAAQAKEAPTRLVRSISMKHKEKGFLET